jgi:hypothetical protein
MTDFTILMFEDEVEWKDSFEYGIKEKVRQKGRNLVIRHRENADTLEQDLFMCNANLIMVDHDLGKTTGDEIINIIDGNPEYKTVSIYYYSGGETIEELERRAAKFACQIRCFTKEGDDLDSAVLGLI